MYEERYEKVFSMEAQLESMLNEFLSNVPTARRTERVMTNIQYLLERYRELHELYSRIDQDTGEVLGVIKHGTQHKPLKDALLSAKSPPQWLVPIVQSTKHVYVDETPDAEEATRAPHDVTLMEMVDTDNQEMPEVAISMKYRSMPTANTNPYTWALKSLAPYMQPIEPPNSAFYKPRPILFSTKVENDHWEAIMDNQIDDDEDADVAFMSHTMQRVEKESSSANIKSAKYVFQKYNTGFSFLELQQGERRRIYSVNPAFTPADEIHIQSWLMMPYDYAKFSRIHLPNLNIMDRVSYSDLYWMKRSSLRHQDITDSTRLIDDFSKNVFSTKKKGAKTTDNKDEDEDEEESKEGAEGAPKEEEKTGGARGKKEATDMTERLKEFKESLAKPTFLNHIQHYVLDSTLLHQESALAQTDLYDQYTNVITPNTFDLVEHMQPYISWLHGMSISNQIDTFEPFLVYMEDLTYTHLNRIRYFIKQRIQHYLKEFHQRKDLCDRVLERYRKWNREMGDFVGGQQTNMVKQMFDNEKIYEIFRSYKIPAIGWNETDALAMPLTNSELLKVISLRDFMSLFVVLLKTVTITSVVPDEFLVLAKRDMETTMKRAVASSTKSNTICHRHSLAKHYTSLTELQKDNYQDELYYDPDLDDTPYELLNQYKKDIPAKWTDLKDPHVTAFLDMLEQSLIGKHGIDEADAKEYAIRLLTKKRRVLDGEYALLDLSKDDFDIGLYNNKYYKRKGNLWVKDPSVEEEAFMDLPALVQQAFQRKKKTLNQMFCEGSADCMKDPTTQICQSTQEAEDRILARRRQLAQGELGKRIDLSMREQAKALEKEIETVTHRLFNIERWRYCQRYKWNFAADHIAKLYQTKKEKDLAGDGVGPIVLQSPYVKMRDNILGQHDFAKRQHDIVRFYRDFLREPMTEQLDEDSAWLYCTETNTKLLPRFLYDLALEFVTRGESGYRTLLEKIKQNQEISDDGHAIVDRNSGFTIAQIEWENEDLYDEHGFKIQTGDVMESMEAYLLEEERAAAEEAGMDVESRLATTILESEDTTLIKNIFETLARILEINKKDTNRGLHDFVIRVSVEYIEQNLMTPLDFQIQNEALIKKRGWDEAKIQQQYKLYYHQYMVIVVSSIFLIGLQTAKPQILTKKTVPGCVKSFEGYPLTETTEDLSGIQYMTCILNLIKSSYAPWNAIKSVKRDTIVASMTDQIAEILERRADIHDLYVQQREYRQAHPEEFEIPKEHQIERWTNLLPPSIREIHIVEKLPKDKMDITANQLTPKTAVTVQTQLILYGYGIIEAIHKTTKNKDILLKTNLGIPYVQNACCTEKAGETPIAYFSKESAHIGHFLENIRFYETWLNHWRMASQSSTNVFVDDSSIRRRDVKQGNIEELIYSAFIHYGNFDRLDAPIPDYLTAVCSSKPDPAHYRRNGTLLEKIQDLKDSGRKYHIDDLNMLLQAVNHERKVQNHLQFVKPTAIKMLTDFLSVGKEAEETVGGQSHVDAIRETLLNILVKYDPQIALLENPKEEGEYHLALNDLKNVLIPANQEMRERILNFLVKYGNINVRTAAYQRLVRTLDQIVEWKHSTSSNQEFYEMTQFLKNNITFMVKIIPEMIKNGRNMTREEEISIPRHWDFAPKHDARIKEMILKYYSAFGNFFSPPKESREGEEQSQETALMKILRTISGKMVDLVTLSNLVPVTLPITKKVAGMSAGAPSSEETWFRFMDRDTIKFLFSYMWYSVFDQYIKMTEEELETAFSKTKTARRGHIKATKNLIEETKLKQTMAEFLLVFLKVIQEDKDRIDLSYEEIMKKIHRDRDVEKRGMMARFENVSASDLRYVNMEKKFKIGRWLMEDVHKYKKTRYEQEIEELLYQDLQADGILPEDTGDRLEGRNTEFYAAGQIEELEAREDDDMDLFDQYGEDDDLFDPDREYASDAEDMDYERDV